MRRQVKNLFVTPLWIYQIDNYRFLNKKLIVDSAQYKNGNQNFFDIPGEGIAELKKIVIDAVTEIGVENNWTYDKLNVRSRLNPMNPGEYDTPHHHPDADMLGIYYLNTPDNCGNIQFLDCRGSVSNLWKDPNIDSDGVSRDGRVCVKLTPEPGMLLFFPNYLIHSVEPNFSNEVRLSVVFDFKLINESICNGY
jgi:uncharacterized protein (TIGR02466 family)